MTSAEARRGRAAKIVRDAGGQIIGRTRLQKVGYFLELAGLGEGYRFRYQYYGPYSDELAGDVKSAWAFGLLDKIELPSSWGGSYSIYSSNEYSGEAVTEARLELAKSAAEIDAVALELAATAAFLQTEGYDDPWEETKRRKPDKATTKHMREARAAYRRLKQIKTPNALPDLD